MSTQLPQPQSSSHQTSTPQPAAEVNKDNPGQKDGNNNNDPPLPTYSFWDTLAWGFRNIFDRSNRNTTHDPHPNLQLESFLFYLLVAILFCVEIYIWFNGFDSILRNYLLRQYNIEARIQVRAIIIAVLVVVVVLNSLKLLSLVMVPFSMASSLIFALLGLGKKKDTPKKLLKDQAIDFLASIGSSLLAWGAISIEVIVSGYLISLLRKDDTSATQSCSGDGGIQSLACIKSELLSYQLPGVSLVVLILTILFAAAFAVVEISLFRADFGPEFKKEKDTGWPESGWTALLVLCILAGLIPPIAYSFFLDGLKRIVISVYASVLVLVIVWSFVRFGIKGAIGYYLRVYSIVASVLITGFSLDVIFYDEPVDHLFKLNESVDIKRRMQAKLAQLGDIPPSPTQPPTKVSGRYLKGSLWRKIEKCIARPVISNIGSNETKPQELASRLSREEQRTQLEDLAALARKEKTERARKKGIAFSTFQPDEWDAVRCYNEYFTDRKEYNAASAHLFANSVLEHRDLYKGINFDTPESIPASMQDWFHLVKGVPENHPRNEGGRSLPIAMTAYRLLDRDNHCKSYRKKAIDCLNDSSFLELAILHDYLEQVLADDEPVKTSKQSALDSKSDSLLSFIRLDSTQRKDDDLEWGWMAPDCRNIKKKTANDGAMQNTDKDKSRPLQDGKLTETGGATAPAPAPADANTDEISQEDLLNLLKKNELCIARHPSLVERNRYKELYVTISKYERLPIKVGDDKLQAIRQDKERLDKEVFEKTEVLAALLASLIQILVILSKLIISSDLYNRIRAKQAIEGAEDKELESAS